MRLYWMFSPNLFGNDANYKLDDSGFGKSSLQVQQEGNHHSFRKELKWDDGYQSPLRMLSILTTSSAIRTIIRVSVMVLTSKMSGWKNITLVQWGYQVELKVDDYTPKWLIRNSPTLCCKLLGWGRWHLDLLNMPMRIFHYNSRQHLMRKSPVGFGPSRLSPLRQVNLSSWSQWILLQGQT